MEVLNKERVLCTNNKRDGSVGRDLLLYLTYISAQFNLVELFFSKTTPPPPKKNERV